MDPISIAASIVGLLGAAAAVLSTLNNFVQGVKTAPKIAQRLLTEVIDISACLSQVQAFLLGVREVQGSHQSLVMVQEIIVVLSNCVMIFSELEEAVDFLKPGQPTLAGQMVRWTLKEPTITALLCRLQSSKTSLGLMISTFTSNSVVEAQISVNQLTMLVKQIVESNNEISQRLASMELRASGDVPPETACPLPETTINDDESVITMRCLASTGGLQHHSLERTDSSPISTFEEDLKTSRPYTRVFAKPEHCSTAMSAINTVGWSCLSSLSMADVSDVSVIALAVDASTLWNSHHYCKQLPAQHRRHTISTTEGKEKLADTRERRSWHGRRRQRLSVFLNRRSSGTETEKERPDSSVSSDDGTRRKKVLLLGASRSGKSTIATHLQLMYGEGFTKSHRLRLRETILNEMITAVMDARLDPVLNNPSIALSFDCEEHFDSLTLATWSGQLDPVYSARCHKPLKSLWQNKRVRIVVEEGPNAALNEGISYYMDHIDELFLTPDIVSDSVMLHVNQKTTGIHSQIIQIGSEAIQVLDVGGRQVERKKWDQCADANKVIFVVALGGYNQSTEEDINVSRMHDDLTLFESVTTHEKYSKLPLALLFNTVDIFLAKLGQFPIKDTFPHYTGGNDPKAAFKFFDMKFREKDRRPPAIKRQNPLEIHITAAPDAECFQSTMKAMHPFLTCDGTKEREKINKASISKPLPLSSTHPAIAFDLIEAANRFQIGVPL